jgi:uncharacterized protein (DUF302 family)
MAADGLITMPSSHGTKETIDRLETELAAKGMAIFARIDHSAAAAQVGLPLRPTELLIVGNGNAKAGTPLMQVSQKVGIDSPLKAIVWEDSQGKTWLSYNDPRWLAKRHELGPDMNQIIESMVAALSTVAEKAAERS